MFRPFLCSVPYPKPCYNKDMSKVLWVFAVFLMLSGMWLPPAIAQTDLEKRPTFMVDPYYNKMVREAIRDRPERFDFMRFRSLYSRSSFYDPIGEDALREINALAYAAMNEEDEERAQGALFGYQTRVSEHMAHIDVVLQALSLARQDKRFGDAQFFEWMRDGLVKTVVISGDGYSLKGAYDVITPSEEVLLFRRLGFRSLETKNVKQGGLFYNIHTVEQAGEADSRVVFVNTTIPLRYLEMLEDYRSKNTSLDIRKR